MRFFETEFVGGAFLFLLFVRALVVLSLIVLLLFEMMPINFIVDEAKIFNLLTRVDHSLLLGLIQVAIGMIWAYKVHENIGKKYKGYKIKPSDSVIFLAIPVINIWGFWSVFKIFISTAKKKGGKTRKYALVLDRLLLFLYVTVTVRIIAAIYIPKSFESGHPIELMIYALGLGGVLIFLVMVGLVHIMVGSKQATMFRGR